LYAIGEDISAQLLKHPQANMALKLLISSKYGKGGGTFNVIAARLK
jgi:hypothetical protein